MKDLRYVKAVKTKDDLTGLEYFRIAVNITQISENPTTLNIYGNERGTKCREITVQICGGDGNLEDINGIMWEKTYQHYFLGLKKTLPQTTMAEFKKSFDGNNFNLIVYAFDGISLLCGDIENPSLTTFELTQMFAENYKDFYMWLKEEEIKIIEQY